MNNWTGNITIGGMDLNDFVQQALRQGSVRTGNSFSMSSSNMTDEEEIPTKEFGKEMVDRIVVGNENLVFDGTVVKLAKTRASIVLKNDAEIGQADADSQINAENCKSLGKLNAGGAIKLSNCSAVKSNAGGKIVAEDCENVGHLNAGGKVELTNCSFGSANAGGKVEADNCQNFKKISAGGKVEIQNSTVDNVSAGGKVDIRKTTIKETLEFSQDSTIANSTVQSIVVHPNRGNSGVTIINGRVMGSSIAQKNTNIYLENSIVESIEFVTKGKVFLRGNSQVRGTVVNGEIV